jgi:hypothetical protein
MSSGLRGLKGLPFTQHYLWWQKLNRSQYCDGNRIVCFLILKSGPVHTPQGAVGWEGASAGRSSMFLLVLSAAARSAAHLSVH